MLELLSSTLEINKVETDGGTESIMEQHFRCRALKKGTAEVQLNLRGPDIQHIWQQKTFPVDIR